MVGIKCLPSPELWKKTNECFWINVFKKYPQHIHSIQVKNLITKWLSNDFIKLAARMFKGATRLNKSKKIVRPIEQVGRAPGRAWWGMHFTRHESVPVAVLIKKECPFSCAIMTYKFTYYKWQGSMQLITVFFYTIMAAAVAGLCRTN